jgi:glycosyltransferase involved in cell wall biosynthesis
MTDPQPKISVVCAWYNRASHLRATLDSLLAQDYSNFDIILVNDGSTEADVRTILDGYDDPRLRVIHQENAGFCAAIMHAVAASDGEFIAVQGAGDLSLPGRLSAQSNFLQANPAHAVVGCRYINQIKGPMGDLGQRPAKILTLDPTAADITRGNPFGHGEVMMRRSAYQEVGGYRAFFENAQDKDLWMRISQHHKLKILDGIYYQRGIFIADGIASDLKKTLRQLAYSQMADLCHAERLRGEVDSVARFGQLALMRAPRGWSTTWRIIRALKQVVTFGTSDTANLHDIRKLFGLPNYLIAVAAFWALRVLKPLFRTY